MVASVVLLIAIFLPWLILREPPHPPPVDVSVIPTRIESDWDLHGRITAFAQLGILVCASLFIMRKAGVRTKAALVLLVLISSAFLAADTVSVAGELRDAKRIFGETLTSGSGIGAGLLLAVLSQTILVFVTLITLGSLPQRLGAVKFWGQHH